MRKLLLILSLTALSGCAWLGFGDNSDTVATAEPVASSELAQPDETPVAEPATPASSKSKAKATKTKKGAKSEEQIKVELDAMGKKLAGQSARTIMPNKAHPEYKQVGNEWVASYIDVDPNRVTTELRPGASGQYVGLIYYQERYMECRGKTKQAALSGDCRQVRTRNLKEMIRYDGKVWQD